MKKDLTSLRQDYAGATFDELHAHPHPLIQFTEWFDQAMQSQLPEPNAMILSTVDIAGRPHARVVLLKVLDESGFVFFTNYQSNKGNELALNPNASLVFIWLELQRQVRVEGLVKKVSEAESDAYFQSRPRLSQLGAVVSPQSQIIPNRKFLEDKFAQLEKEYREKPVERPSFWGGYRLFPERIEFWQGRQNRMHDRLLYELSENGWSIKRLAP